MAIKRLKIEVNGIVQGVGFRPFVYRIARENRISGFVTNTSNGVIIEAEGDSLQLQQFMDDLKSKNPILAQIDSITEAEVAPKYLKNFIIEKSQPGREIETLISPDTATCGDCLTELFDPKDRRYRYPFINCTNCGPRFTIIKDIPYDRPKTTMAEFTLCDNCKNEYNDPNDRRFHAQPNACPVCGPKIWLEKSADKSPLGDGDEALKQVTELLLSGKIIAVKGLGGFHLMVDATNPEAVSRLRKRKNREEKALAIMVDGLETVNKICHVSKMENEILTSYQTPIVLLRKKKSINLSVEVAPGNPYLGVMLPYTPLHHLILRDFAAKTATDTVAALVATSGNLSEEPIAITNDDARERLKDIADYFLFHNRQILLRADDSVIHIANDKPLFFRRSRGYAPKPITIVNKGPQILGAGPELKNVVAIAKNNRAFLSQHIGDMENLLAYNSYLDTVSHIQRITSTEPRIIAHDMHPGYLSTQWALEQTEKDLFAIQHHHAHMAAVMTEYQIDRPVIAIIMDGTGFGYDKKIWGGEFLVGDYSDITRFHHLDYMPLPGGDAAIKHPWRTATAYLFKTFGSHIPELPFLQEKDSDRIIEMVKKNINCVETSSCGRLFDAVAAMAGGKTSVHYEAQAAIEMMNHSENNLHNERAYDVHPAPKNPAIEVTKIIENVVEDALNGVSFSTISKRFHKTLVQLFTEVALLIRENTHINEIVLGGGVFQNIFLLRELNSQLRRNNFSVFIPEKAPLNDGGIALGQISIARKLIEKKMTEATFNER